MQLRAEAEHFLEEAGAFLKRPFLEQRVVRRIRLDFQLVVGDLDLIEPQLLPL